MNYLDVAQGKLSAFTSIQLNQSNINEKVERMKELKTLMYQFNTLPPSPNPPNENEFLLSLAIIEAEMEFALQLRDEKKFESAFLKSKQFYYDFSKLFPRLNTPKKYYYIGLYLLHLLSNNRTTDFSTEIELIPIEELKNENIQISRKLERCIMEGNYKEIQNLKTSSDDFYNYYLSKFDNTIRFQIARSAEKSYDSIKIEDAISLLMFNDQNQLLEFVKAQNQIQEDREIDWKIADGKIYFVPLNKEKPTVPANRIVYDTVLLGIELEQKS